MADRLTNRWTSGRLGWNGACIGNGSKARNARPGIQRGKLQLGGAAGLVAAVVQVAANVGVDNIVIANGSLNNLLQNADIHAIENILNNSLNNNDVLNDLTVVVSGTTISVLSGTVVTDTITIVP